MTPARMNLSSIYDRSLDAVDASRFMDVGSIALERGLVQGRAEAAAEQNPHQFDASDAQMARSPFKRAATIGAYIGASTSRALTPPITDMLRLGTMGVGLLFGSRQIVGQSTGMEYASGFTGLLEFAGRGLMSAAGWLGAGIGAAVGATCGKAGAAKGAAVGFNVAGAPIAVCLGILMGLGRSVGFAIDQVVGVPLVLVGALLGVTVASVLAAYRAACPSPAPAAA